MKKIFTLAAAMVVFVCTTNAQRYLEEVFNDVTVTQDVTYGMNATVIAYQMLGEAIPEALKCDIYEPSGDVETNRPLILYFHTGNFIPHPQNGSPGGTRTDINAVEMCTRLAKMGYVVASCDYRLGWNPIASTQDERVYTLINAAYRGVQDCRTAIRYFRMSEEEMSNPYGIDPDKVCVWGQGTGGYIAFAAATINTYSDIVIPKFTHPVEVQPGVFLDLPMVIESVNGDIYGTSFGINPLDGDTLCYVNHPGYSSDFNVMVNMGGALGDSSWIDAGDPPMISFHVPTDPFAPYNIGTVIVPGFNLPVVEVSGSYNAQMLANELNLNAAFEAVEDDGDVYTATANMFNDGYYGLYPMNRPSGMEADSAPWEWWEDTNPNNSNGLLTNPDMSEAKGMLFLDTIQWYSAPRLMCALMLPGSPCEVQGPDNDLCEDASDINAIFGGAVNVPVMSTTFSNTGATGTEDLSELEGCWLDGPEDGTTLTNNASVWFSFEGDGNDYILVVDNCDGETTFDPMDTQMAIYSGDNCGNMELVACNDDIDFANDIYWSGALFETEDNTNYFVVIDGFDYTQFGNEGIYGEGDFCLTAVNYVVSVEELSAVSFTMFPNPAKDMIRISSKEKMDNVVIHNLVGDIVWSQSNVNASSTEVNLNLSAGIYLVEVQTSSGKATQKLVIE